jgi:excisionase family DNA binding protein
MTMWQRFTQRARNVVFFAQEEATGMGHGFVGTEHLLLGLVRERDHVAARLMTRMGVDLDAIRPEIERQAQRGTDPLGQELQLTPRSKRVIDLAYEEARELNNNYVGTEHLLLGLIGEGEGLAARVLRPFGVDVERARREVILEQELLDLDAAVQFLGTSKPTLYRLLRQGELKGLKVGRQWRFRKPDLEAYMERGRLAAATAPTPELETEISHFSAELRRLSVAETGSMTSEPGNSTREERVQQLAEAITALALALGASDLHLEPVWNGPGTYLLLRARVDGILQELRRMPMSLREGLTARFKQMARIDLARTEAPQEGSFTRSHAGSDYVLETSTLPTYFGEAVTFLIRNITPTVVDLEQLDLSAEDRSRLRDWTRRPRGLVVATGPGALPLLYSCLREIAGPERKIVTIQQSGGHRLRQAVHVEVRPEAGLTFTAALRACARQAADVVLVGDLPDAETAALAHELALDRCLVLATARAGSAAGVLQGLLDLGLEPRLVARALVGIVAHAMAGQLCPDCKTAVNPESAALLLTRARQSAPAGGYLVPQDAVFHQGRGCEACRQTGYQGHVDLFEVVEISPALAQAILRRASAEEITGLAVANGSRTLLADGVRKAVEGLTSLDAVLRETGGGV